jgi:MFS family permease
MMDPIPVPPRPRGNTLEMALGGVRFVRKEPVVLSIFVLDWFVNVLGSIRALMPVFARDIIDVGPEGLGLLYAAPGVGAVTGAVILGAVGMRWRHPAAILTVFAAFGLCIIGFGLSSFFPLSLVMLFGTGVCDVVGEVIRHTIVQLRTPDELRGRVTAMGVVFTNGGPQLGQLQSGAMGSFLGPMEAAVIGGAGVFIAVMVFTLNGNMRSMTMPEARTVPAEEPPPEPEEAAKREPEPALSRPPDRS